MIDDHSPSSIASFLRCLSLLETKTYQLYKAISEKTEAPLAKSLLFGIAVDSQKHAELLNGVAVSIIPKQEINKKECERRIGETLNVIAKLAKEIDAKKKINEQELQQLINKLDVLESTVGEEYSVFVQLKTLEIMSKEINRLYNVDLTSVKNIFVSIINDEEHHRTVIESIKASLTQQKQQNLKEDPLAEYRNILKNNNPPINL